MAVLNSKKLISIGLGFFLAVCTLGAKKKQIEEPKILRKGKDVTVQLNQQIQLALKSWNPKAKILGIDNFPDAVWKLYTPRDPESLPMATLGDFNGDGKKDVGLLVSFNNRLQAIAVVSKTRGYRVHEIRTFSLNNRNLFKLHKKRIVSQVYLFTERSDKLKHSKKVAVRDGLQVEILNSADTRLFYIKKGAVQHYVGLVK